MTTSKSGKRPDIAGPPKRPGEQLWTKPSDLGYAGTLVDSSAPGPVDGSTRLMEQYDSIAGASERARPVVRTDLMSTASDKLPPALDEALQRDSMPLWLWHPAEARIVWANAAYLDYCGADSLDDLRRLRFDRAAEFVRQLARLAGEAIEAGGRRELICFSNGRGAHVIDCLCRNTELASGEPGLLIGLVSDHPDLAARIATETHPIRKETPAASKPVSPRAASDSPWRNGAARSQLLNGAATAPEETPREEAPEKMQTESEPGETAQDETAQDETAQDETAQDETAQDETAQGETAQGESATAGELLIEPVRQNGFYGGEEEIDEEDLLTLQEIARMINAPSGAGGFHLSDTAPPRPHFLADAPERAEPAQDHPVEPAVKQGGKADIASLSRQPATGARETAAAESPLQPRSRERNYFLESLPAAVAIAMGGRLMRANEAFLHAFGFGSESELRRAGGLARLFPDSLEGILPLPGGGDIKPRAARLEMNVVSRSGRKRRLPVAFRNVSTGREPVQILILEDEHLGAKAASSRIAAPVSATAELPLDAAAPVKRETMPPASDPASDPGGDSVAFLAKVSHEVRTPLNSIIGFSELMKDERLKQNDIGKMRGYAADIHESAMHALSLINELLDTSKIMAGKPELTLQPCDLNEIVRETLQLMTTQLSRRKLQLRQQLADDLPRLMADRRSLRQVLLNLVSNAVKFTQPGGRIEVATSRLPDGGVQLSVSDTGIGMRQRQISEALQPYAQLQKVLKVSRSDDDGTGLGLPLTKALVEAHGAGFQMDSTLGLGTRVSIFFPSQRLA